MSFEKPQSTRGTQRRTFLARSIAGAAALAGVELSAETSEAAVEPPTAGGFRDNLLQMPGRAVARAVRPETGAPRDDPEGRLPDRIGHL